MNPRFFSGPDMTATAPITDANPTVEEMERLTARFHDLRATADYVDSGIPGCERTTLRVLGKTPDAPLEAEGFHMSIVLCDPGKAAPLHNHLTQEVFLALTGEWEVFWGPEGARSLMLKQWDTVSIPPGMASGRDPGNINWPRQVRELALAAGVALPSVERTDPAR